MYIGENEMDPITQLIYEIQRLNMNLERIQEIKPINKTEKYESTQSNRLREMLKDLNK